MERDLLAFENRIQYNFRKNKKIATKYKIFTISGIIILLYLIIILATGDISDKAKSWHVFTGILTTFILFMSWAVGILGDKLSCLQTFTRRMNNSLKPFHLSIGSNGSLQFRKSIPQNLIQNFQEYKRNVLESMAKDS